LSLIQSRLGSFLNSTAVTQFAGIERGIAVAAAVGNCYKTGRLKVYDLGMGRCRMAVANSLSRKLCFKGCLGMILSWPLLDFTCLAQQIGPAVAEQQYPQIPVSLVAYGGSTDPVSSSSIEGSASVATPEIAHLLTRLISQSLPPVYHDERKWNQEKEVWDGVYVRLRDGKLETRGKTKLVKAGTWTRYTVRLVDPEEKLHVQFDRLEVIKGKGMSFAVTLEADLDLFGQLNEWARDVRLFSISAHANATVRLQVEGTVRLKVNPLKLPPDMTLIPQVERAHLDLISYRVKEVSHVRGDAAKLLGKSMKAIVHERLKDENQRLTAKMNRQLAKRSHKMTISGDDWLKSQKTASKSNLQK